MLRKIFQDLIDSDLITLVFIIISIIVLSLLQLFFLRYKYKHYFICGMHFCFGVLLSNISNYLWLVHLVIYIIPSVVLSIVIYYTRHFLKSVATVKETYTFTYKTNKGDLKLHNPFLGIAVFGAPGCGKSESLIKPTIKNMAEKDFCGIIYDYKQFELTNYAHVCYSESPVDFKSVNFFNISTSSRINPIAPGLLKSPSYASEAAKALFSNLIKVSEHSDSFWTESAECILAAIIWRLKEDFSDYCYLPYAIAICLQKKPEELASFIKKNRQSSLLASSYLQGLSAEKQTAGVLSHLSNALRKIAIPEIFYILSGNDFSLDLNNKQKPTLLCISNYQLLQETFSPVISLIISMSLKLMNDRDKHHSVLLLDEGTSLLIPGLSTIPATARGNKIATFFCIQDMVQGEGKYGRIGRDELLATLSIMFFGKVNNPQTAEWYSKVYGTAEKKFKSYNRKVGELSTSSYSESVRDVVRYKPQDFISLETGHFFGVISQGNMKEFKGKFEFKEEKVFDLPIINNVTDSEIKTLFNIILDKALELN